MISSGAFKLKWGTTAACTTGSEVLSMTSDHFMWFASLDGKLNYRYFAFTASEDTGDDYYEISKMWMGEYIELDYNPQNPMEIIIESINEEKKTSGGQNWNYPFYKRRGYALDFSTDFSPTAYDVLKEIYEEKGKRKPFFFYLKPTDCLSSYSYDSGYLAHFDEWSFSIDGKDARPGRITIIEEK